jgi:prevent-host-death family protein
MKPISLTEAKAALNALVESAQAEGILLLKHGKPVALLFGVEGVDLVEALTRLGPDLEAQTRAAAKSPQKRRRPTPRK